MLLLATVEILLVTAAIMAFRGIRRGERDVSLLLLIAGATIAGATLASMLGILDTVRMRANEPDWTPWLVLFFGITIGIGFLTRLVRHARALRFQRSDGLSVNIPFSASLVSTLMSLYQPFVPWPSYTSGKSSSLKEKIEEVLERTN